MVSPAMFSAEMASRKLQALAFIRAYFADTGASPSYGEIAAGIGSSKSTVRRAIAQLRREGRIRRDRGAHRGIELPDATSMISRDDAVRRLRADGYIVDEDIKRIGIADTNPALQQLPLLDYTDPIDGGEIDDSGNASASRGDARDRSAREQKGARRAA